ncbi:hypothetical protein GCM10022409_19270 [Hymenobacter glaciei]|uniref:Knr4/Smi1-like domain-containing protein n=1 Tax=Hymenobacter glaciei TaxID=877209 RepID=A0ABP7U2Y2_9BACT
MKEIVLNGVATAVNLERYPAALPSETQVEQFEQALGHRLPPDYRTFLLTYNGGVCDFERMLMPIEVYICDLFGLPVGDSAETLVPLLLPNSPQLTELWDDLPANLLPIGETDGGDMVAIRFLPKGSEVVVLDHESSALREMLRASTFTELLLSTCPPDEDDE